MLVIFSDIHLTDETTASNVSPEAFSKILHKEIDLAAVKNEAKEIRIVLLGDVLDFVRTDYWLKLIKQERPWNGTLDKKTAMNNDTAKMDHHYGIILEDIMKTKSAKAFVNMLNSLSKKFSKDIPVNISYIIGNHDRILNTSAVLKEKIMSHLNAYTNSSVDFTNEYLNAADYSVLCRHGHEWDNTNYGIELYKFLNNKGDFITRFDREIYKLQTIGEVITGELMSGIIFRVKEKINDPKIINTLKELNNVRPLSDAFIWLYWYGVTISSKNKNILLSAFKESLNDLIKTDLAKLWDNTKTEIFLFSGDITDRFEQMLGLVEDLDFDHINKYVEVFKIFDNLFGSTKDDFVEGAKSEFKNKYYIEKDIQYILYGHTHEARHDYFFGDKDGKAKMYINTGTFLPYIQKTLDHKTFASAFQMTMVFIYRRDEDTEDGVHNKHPTMELWNGIKRKVYKS